MPVHRGICNRLEIMRRPSARAGGEKNGRAVQMNCAAVFLSVVLPAPQALPYHLLLVLNGSLCGHRYIAPIISYPHAHIQARPLVDSPAGRKAVDILLCIVDRQRKGADFDVVIRVKFAICIVSGSQIPAELIL